MGLDKEALERYSRQIKLPEIGEKGQAALLGTSVLCVGTGGLGSAAICYLAAAGIGRIGVVDKDTVELSNLQRQILHGVDCLGVPKAESCARFVRRLNPDVQLDLYQMEFTPREADEIVPFYDFVLDGSDNYETRYILNDAAFRAGKPFVHASVLGFEGQLATFMPWDNLPCYRCVYPSPPSEEILPDAQEPGVMGIVPGLMGVLQATEIIKLVLGIGVPFSARMLLFNALDGEFRTVNIRKDPGCACCGAIG